MAPKKAPFIPNKDYLEKCIVFMYEKNLIVNNAMDKEEARALFKAEFTQIFGSHHNFTGVLTGWSESGFLRNGTKNKVKFEENVVNNALLEQEKIRNKSKAKKKRSWSKKQSTVCNICDIQFATGNEYRVHITSDEQHYFRGLYINKSKLLKNSCRDIVVEMNPGSGCKPEILIVRKDDPIPPLLIKNNSKHAYKILSIIQLHLPPCPIKVLAANVKKSIMPYETVILEVHGSFKNNNSQLFVHVFIVQNLQSNVTFNIIKEVNIQVNSEAFDELQPTIPYKKPEAVVLNDIDTSKFIRASASTTTPMFEGTVELKSYKLPVYIKKILNAGLKPFEGMNETEAIHLQRISKLLNVASPKDCLKKKNYQDMLQLLLYMEEHQMCKDIRNYDMNTQEIVSLKKPNFYELKVPGLAEHRPSLMPGDSVFVKSANAKDTFQGIVKNINENSVVLNFNRRFADVYMERGSFSVSYDFSRSNIRAEHRSVELISKHNAVSHFFPKHTGQKAMKTYNIVWFNDKISNNPEQQQAVLHILSESSYPAPYLIFGPPGTGKTMTIIEAISQIWKLKPNSRMLVCAPSNSVANEITCRLAEYVPPSELFRYLAVSFHLDGVPQKIRSCVNYDENDFFHPTFHELLQYRIVITTLSNASRIVSFGVPANHFNYVFIDESGHATETETLIPIAGILTTKSNMGALYGQIVLAGDPQQLGPVIHSSLARQYGFGTSMLERMMSTLKLYQKNPEGQYNPRALTKLLRNYRSHPKILTLPNKLFYENELISNGDDLVWVALGWSELPNPKVPIIFHSVIGVDQREANSPSYFNIQEIEMVLYYLSRLIGTHLKGVLIKQEDIGIIAPYRKQVQKIRQVCERIGWNDITVGSVEQFQGQERLVIITSTVRSQPTLLKYDSKFHLGFLNNPKRFNVAVTRAKALLIVIGNPNLLQHEKYWREFIKFCQANKCFIGSDFVFSEEKTDDDKDDVVNSLNMAKLRVNDVTEDVVDFSRGNV